MLVPPCRYLFKKKKPNWRWLTISNKKNHLNKNSPRRLLKSYFWSRPTEGVAVLAMQHSISSNLRFYDSYSLFWEEVWVSSFQKTLSRFFSLYESPLLNLSRMWRFSNSHLEFPQRSLTPPLHSFIRFYKNLIFHNSLKFGQFTYFKKRRPSSLFDHRLYLTFSPNRFYANLRDKNNLNYFSLSVGLFLKFFNQQKSLKKTKTFRFLLVKFLRKILIVSGISQFIIFFKRPPILLPEIFRFLTAPLITPFYDPVSGKFRVEDEKQFSRFSFKYFFFVKTVSYTTMKGKQRGRLKRKISKKIIKRNRISDEA